MQTFEQEQLILDNQRLVHYVLKKLGASPTSTEYDDLASIGTFGLIKAAQSFDESKKTKFSSYASRCILNELLMYFRKNKKRQNDISIYSSISSDDSGKLMIMDTLEDSKSDFENDFLTQESLNEMISIILNCLEPLKRAVILYYLADMTQKNISIVLNISPSYVSRLTNKAILEIKNVFNNLSYAKDFYVSSIDYYYKITFVSKDSNEFNVLLLTKLKSLELSEVEFTMSRNKINMILPRQPESFISLVKILREIDDFRKDLH